ncbi:low molecular weight protein tyrosine phosphatase family protein [Lewinella sp. IMCC34183]|uniref:low molecular weight protein tyrosine phosphatase family protein n=1 Tax=Lewinella sp. IMCC34183 TaxID=2248762 RepID=UPI000E26BC07|nr:protein tyrosine phosphatase [Lewinella sp. IMCC34183]
MSLSVPRLLFICSRNEWRSRTAETLYRNDDRFAVRSAGTAKSARTRVNAAMLEWADTILVMEEKHRDILLSRFERRAWADRIVVLEIPDEYRYMDAELVGELRAAVDTYCT